MIETGVQADSGRLLLFLAVALRTRGTLFVIEVCVRDKIEATLAIILPDLNNAPAGWLTNSEGGQAHTEKRQRGLAGGHPVRKHPGNVVDIAITRRRAPSNFMTGEKSLNYSYDHKDGAIITCDYDYQELVRLNFFEALIAEIGFSRRRCVQQRAR